MTDTQLYSRCFAALLGAAAVFGLGLAVGELRAREHLFCESAGLVYDEPFFCNTHWKGVVQITRRTACIAGRSTSCEVRGHT
jgi:hypothetical protein